MELELLSSLQLRISLLYFSIAAGVVLLAALLFVQRLFRPWCGCEVCRAYLSCSWRREFGNMSDWYAHLLRSSPTGTVAVHVLGATVTANPDNVEYMLKTRFDNFPKGRTFSAILGDLLGGGIFNVDGERWRFQRKMASLELGSVSVRSYAFDIVSAEVRTRLRPFLLSNDGAGVFDLQDVFKRLSFDTICKISFGVDPGCLELSLPASEFAAAFDLASCLSAKRAMAVAPAVWKLKRLLNLGSERELRRAVGMVNNLAVEVIRQRRKLGFSSNHDLLSRFMASVDDDKYLRDIVISFLLAGRDTVASGLTTFFYLLSKHPGVAKVMRDEIDSAMGDDGQKGEMLPASYEQLRSMSYVHAAIYESLRLFPPVQFDSKFCVDDDVLPDGTFVAGGSRVTYHPYAMGRMEAIWGRDCLEFKPERWLGPDGQFMPESLFRFPVFQAGPRLCLGKEMSIMEMKAVVVAVVREFDIEVVAGERPPMFAPGLTASISGGLPVKARLRAGLC